MSVTSDLVRAAVENPEEESPLSMLADHLIESGDGKGEILRRWLAQPQKKRRTDYHYLPFDWDDDRRHHHVSGGAEEFEGGHRMKVTIGSRVKAGGHPRSDDDLYGFVEMVDPTHWQGRQYPVRLTHPEARQIADGLPNAEEVHKFLDRHFGSDPRFTDSLNDALKQKPE